MAGLPRLSECSIDPSKPGFEQAASVYNILLQLEQEASEQSDKDLLQSARILGAFLTFFSDFFWLFGPLPLEKITNGIVSRDRDPEPTPPTSADDSDASYYAPVVKKLGGWYRHHIVRVYRSNKGPTPQPMSHPSRPSFDSLQAMMDEYLKGSGTNYDAAKRLALAREGFRCILTGHYDLSSCMKNEELMRRVNAAGLAYLPTECCHIFSQATVQNVSKETGAVTDDKRQYATAVLAVMKSFGLDGLARDIASPNGVHDLSNIMIMSTGLHTAFDLLHFWLEPARTANEYIISGPASALLSHGLQPGTTVRFQDHSDRGLALPDRRLLALHAACARVVHMSGAAEYFERWEDDDDQPPFLLPDGSSADRLVRRLNHELMIAS
ncbi:hypothetical protein AURDEDRAFT_117942 [Auricularia subglabra TFB-10046 SS5]|uniref:HNH nuclease domain-containing protein n=1 Tax=Auricularia subglabra (strain TFB-10046 / SS5) TaxID=717982 RepID=J0WL85_AURST|nr:hypothetical protein AURDEDRAFT_117942 [Auricularia subglabra TFB-10046 SS5]